MIDPDDVNSPSMHVSTNCLLSWWSLLLSSEVAAAGLQGPLGPVNPILQEKLPKNTPVSVQSHPPWRRPQYIVINNCYAVKLPKINMVWFLLWFLLPSFHLPQSSNFSLATGYSISFESLLVCDVHPGLVPVSLCKNQEPNLEWHRMVPSNVWPLSCRSLYLLGFLLGSVKFIS